MSPEQPDLANLQRWMQEVVVHQGTIDEAVASAAAESENPAFRLGEVILPSHSLSPAERVGVYHGMYLMRMEETLAADYPVIKHFLGAESFDELVRDYVTRYPSRSYTLNRLGDDLPRFLDDRPDWSQGGFLADLARLELAMTEVFDELQSPVLSGEDLPFVQDLDPRGSLPELEDLTHTSKQNLDWTIFRKLLVFHDTSSLKHREIGVSLRWRFDLSGTDWLHSSI